MGEEFRKDSLLGNFGGALHAAAHDPLPELADADEAAVLGAGGAADLDDADGELEVEVVDTAAEQLGPDVADAAADAADPRGGGGGG